MRQMCDKKGEADDEQPHWQKACLYLGKVIVHHIRASQTGHIFNFFMLAFFKKDHKT